MCGVYFTKGLDGLSKVSFNLNVFVDWFKCFVYILQVETVEANLDMQPFQSTEKGDQIGDYGRKGRSKQKVTFAVQKNTPKTPPSSLSGI